MDKDKESIAQFITILARAEAYADSRHLVYANRDAVVLAYIKGSYGVAL